MPAVFMGNVEPVQIAVLKLIAEESAHVLHLAALDGERQTSGKLCAEVSMRNIAEMASIEFVPAQGIREHPSVEACAGITDQHAGPVMSQKIEELFEHGLLPSPTVRVEPPKIAITEHAHQPHPARADVRFDIEEQRPLQLQTKRGNLDNTFVHVGARL